MNRRLAAWSAGLLPGLVSLYILLAGAAGAIAVNREFRPTPVAAGGIAIYLRTNGFHADIVVPTDSGDQDWSAWFPPSDMRATERPTAWIAFSWGDRAFMLETPTWRDIRLGTSLRALAGLGMGAMHVEYVRRRHPDAAPRTGTLKRLARDLPGGSGSLTERIAALHLGDVVLESWEDVDDPAGGEPAVFLQCAREIHDLLSALRPVLVGVPA